MKATEIRPGDVLLGGKGQLHYTVLAVTRERNQIIAEVQYLDGGTEYRVWEDWQSTPIKHPVADTTT